MDNTASKNTSPSQPHPEPLRSTNVVDFANGSNLGGNPSKKKKGNVAFATELEEAKELEKAQEMFISHEERQNRPSVDEHLESEGRETFLRFERRINSLRELLQEITNSRLQLRASADGFLSSTKSLRQQLSVIVTAFGRNSADLFPRKAKKNPNDSGSFFGGTIHRTPTYLTLSNFLVADDPLPDALAALAKNFKTFRTYLSEFHELTNTGVNNCISTFENDLEYHAACLGEYDDQLHDRAVQLYINNISDDLGKHAEHINIQLKASFDIGLQPMLRNIQEEAAKDFLHFSAFATFVSAVTATTAQYSFQNNDRIIEIVVNLLWFGSIVLSSTSAVNSLLGVLWVKQFYREQTPRNKMYWIRGSALASLVASIALFSAGLVCFCWATQKKLVAITVSALMGLSSFGVMGTFIWHMLEKYSSYAINIVKSLLGLGHGIFRTIGKALDYLHRVRRQKSVRQPDEEAAEPSPDAQDTYFPKTLSPVDTTAPSPLPSPTTRNDAPTQKMQHEEGEEHYENTHGSAITPHKRLRNVMKVINVTRLLVKRKGTTDTTSSAGSEVTSRRHSTLVSNDGESPSKLPTELRNLKVVQSLDEHPIGVKHLQFSPCGQWLATCSHDRTTRIWKFSAHQNPPFESHDVVRHEGGSPEQVAWSHDGLYLLTRSAHIIKVYKTQNDGHEKTRTFDTHEDIRSVAWLPKGKGFLSVTQSAVERLDLNGNIKATYNFERHDLQDVAITPDQKRIIAVATLLQSGKGSQPKTSRPEKRIIIYNVKQRAIEYKVPISNDPSNIVISQDGKYALVSYKKKAPPELWGIHVTKDGGKATLSLSKTYMPKGEIDFAGASTFGRASDELVLCPTKAGEILIWQRDTAVLLHSVPPIPGCILTGIAWRGTDHQDCLLASAAEDGKVRIWNLPRPSDLRPTNLTLKTDEA